MTKAITTAALVAGSQAIDRMREEIKIVTGMILGAPIDYGKLAEKDDPVVYEDEVGLWCLRTRFRPYSFRYYLREGDMFFVEHFGRDDEVSAKNVKRIHSSMNNLIEGMLRHFNQSSGGRLASWLQIFADAAD